MNALVFGKRGRLRVAADVLWILLSGAECSTGWTIALSYALSVKYSVGVQPVRLRKSRLRWDWSA